MEGKGEELQITGLGERARRDPRVFGSFHDSSVFAGIDGREKERERKGGQDAKPSGFNLLTRHGDYAVLMTPWDCISARHFFLRWLTGVAVLFLPMLLSYRSHHPDRSGLPRNNKRHIAWATIAHVYT